MKTYRNLLLIFLFPLLFISCSDDDKDNNESTGTGTLTVDGISYELSQGIIYNRERWESNQGYNFDVDLLSSDFNMDNLENPTGIGHMVALEMFCESTDNLNGGSYIVDTTDVFPAGTFCGIIVTNFDAHTEEGGTFYIISTGNSVVVRSGDSYEFTINVLAIQLDEYLEDEGATDVPISCYYKGTLKKDGF